MFDLTPTIDYLNKNYPSIHALKIYKIKHTNINSKNFLVVSEHHNYVLRSFANSDNQRMEKICKILSFCIRNNINVIEPVMNKNNQFVDNKHSSYLIRFYEGDFFSGKERQLTEFAKSVALLHKVLKTIKIRLKNDYEQQYYKLLNEKEFEIIKNTIRRKSSLQIHDKLVYKNIRMLNDTTEFIENNKNNDHKFVQLTHSDLHPKNVLYYREKPVILDFDTMRRSSLIDDIAFGSFRFSIFRSVKKFTIKNDMKKFLNSYLLSNNLKIEFEDEEYFLKKMILKRINYILRNRYFHDSNLWILDLQKHMTSLKLAYSIFK